MLNGSWELVYDITIIDHTHTHIYTHIIIRITLQFVPEID